MDQPTITKTADMRCRPVSKADCSCGRQGCLNSGLSEPDTRLNIAAARKMLAADEADGVLD